MLEIKRPPSVTSILSCSGGQVAVSLKSIPLVKPGREAGDVWWNLPSMESQGCHLIPLLSFFLFCFCIYWLLFLLFFCFVFPPLLFTNFSVFFVMEHTLFCMALVELLGVSWSMVCAACCHRHWCYYVYF